MDTLDFEHRDDVIKQLRKPGREADRLIGRYLGIPDMDTGCCPPYTQSVETALQLLPRGVLFLCGQFDESQLYWCDVGYRPKVQAWGESLAAAIAGAIFAYRTHPECLAAAGRSSLN